MCNTLRQFGNNLWKHIFQ